MRARRFATITGLALALAAGAAMAQTDAPKEESAAWVTVVGEELPSINTRTIDDTDWKSGDPAPATVIHLFACESARCGESLPALEEFLWRPLKGKGLRVVGIARGAHPSDVKHVSARHNITFPLVADTNRALAELIAEKGEGVPRTLILDEAGIVQYQHKGFTPGREAEFRRVVDAILDKKELPEVYGGGATAPGAGDSELGAVNMMGKKPPKLEVETWINEPPADATGKFVMMEFWATWCPPCRMAMPHLEEASKKYKDKLVIMSVSNEDPETVRKFVNKEGFTYPLGTDTKSRTSKALKIQGIPHGLLVSPAGVVIWQGNPLEFKFEESKLEKLLATGS